MLRSLNQTASGSQDKGNLAPEGEKEPPFHIIPVDQAPPLFDKFPPPVLIIKVVRMLPYVTDEDGNAAPLG